MAAVSNVATRNMPQDPALFGNVSFIQVSADQAGQRIDNFLSSRLKGVPKSRIYRLLRKGEVRVNKKRIKPEYRVAAEDMVRIPPVRTAQPPKLPVAGAGLRHVLATSVIYENDDVLVVDKPAGLAVHGGSGINLGLIEALRQMRPDQKYLELVHRIDRDTSGCLLVAKKRSALRALQTQFREGRIDKHYRALVRGSWPRKLTHIEAPLTKNTLPSGEWLVRVDKVGKPASTLVTLLEAYAGASLLDVCLETGRTHQIRVHCQSVGHPLAGDSKYGDEAFNGSMRALGLQRMFLHAVEVVFALPGRADKISVRAPQPTELNRILERLGSKRA